MRGDGAGGGEVEERIRREWEERWEEGKEVGEEGWAFGGGGKFGSFF